MSGSETAHITIDNDGNMTIAAYCLRSDSWDDYKAFLKEARLAGMHDDARARARYLRAALTSLFAHLEGVVKEVLDECGIPERRRPLCERVRDVERLAQSRGTPIGALELRFEKYFRDIVAHPGITKIHGFGAAERVLRGSDVIRDLQVDTLEEFGNRVSSWLDSVCGMYHIERFTDIERIADYFAGTLRETAQQGRIHSVQPGVRRLVLF
jgi:hypothetical protein